MKQVGFRLDLRYLNWKPRRNRLQNRPHRVPIRAKARHQTDTADIVGLGNVCMDIRIPVETFPSRTPGWRKDFITKFLDSPIKDCIWETGGITNTLYVTSRLGLSTKALGNLGKDVYGTFCKECLEEEHVGFHTSFTEVDLQSNSDKMLYALDHPFLTRTNICFIMVDPSQRHDFISQFQVNPGPVFLHRSTMTTAAVDSIRSAKALVMNGYALQEYGSDVVEFAFEEALASQTATFFDPGPYGVSLIGRTLEEKNMVIQTLRRSNVVLATECEAAAITGESNPTESGRALLRLTNETTKWVIVKLGERGSLFFQRGSTEIIHTNGFSVPVSDTVGCGDSFAAAIAFGYLITEGHDITGVLELANAVGAITATGCGAGRNVAKLMDVRTLLLNQERVNSTHSRRGIEAALKLLDSSDSSLLVEGASC
eukprot:g4929.t1